MSTEVFPHVALSSRHRLALAAPFLVGLAPGGDAPTAMQLAGEETGAGPLSGRSYI